MANPLVSLATRALKGVAKRTAGRTAVGKAFKAAMADARPAVEAVKKVQNVANTVNKVTNTVEHGISTPITSTIEHGVSTPDPIAELKKELETLRKENIDLKKQLEKKNKPKSPTSDKKQFKTDPRYWKNEALKTFVAVAQTSGQGGRNKAFDAALRFLDNVLSEIKSAKEADDGEDRMYSEMLWASEKAVEETISEFNSYKDATWRDQNSWIDSPNY